MPKARRPFAFLVLPWPHVLKISFVSRKRFLAFRKCESNEQMCVCLALRHAPARARHAAPTPRLSYLSYQTPTRLPFHPCRAHRTSAMPFVSSGKKHKGGDEAGSGDVRVVRLRSVETLSEAGSNEDTVSVLGNRGDAPSAPSENASSDDESDGHKSDTASDCSGDKKDDGEKSGNDKVQQIGEKKTSLITRIGHLVAKAVVTSARTAVATVGGGYVLGKVLDKTVPDEVCVPVLVHGGGALSRELLQKCPRYGRSAFPKPPLTVLSLSW